MSEKDQEIIIRLIKEAFPGILGVYIFGSVAQGLANAESDLDLAVLSNKPTDPVELWRLSQRIASDVGRDVDLVDLRAASLVLRHQILTTGKRIYCHDEFECDFFELTSLSMYLDFNENRRELVDTIKTRGKVYG